MFLSLQLTEDDEAMLSDSEADYDAYDNLSERAHNKLMSPNFIFFRWYATFMLFMLLIFVFYMPVRVAFFPRERWVHAPKRRITRRGCYLKIRVTTLAPRLRVGLLTVANQRSERRAVTPSPDDSSHDAVAVVL